MRVINTSQISTQLSKERPKQSEWEKRFDSSWNTLAADFWEIDDDNNSVKLCPDCVKAFIRQEIEKAREYLLNELLEENITLHSGHYPCSCGFGEECDPCKRAIEELKQKYLTQPEKNDRTR